MGARIPGYEWEQTISAGGQYGNDCRINQVDINVVLLFGGCHLI